MASNLTIMMTIVGVGFLLSVHMCEAHPLGGVLPLGQGSPVQSAGVAPQHTDARLEQQKWKNTKFTYQ